MYMEGHEKIELTLGTACYGGMKCDLGFLL